MKIFSLFALVLSTSVAAQDYVPPQPRQPVAYNPTTTYTSSSFFATANFGGISITVPTYSTSYTVEKCKAANAPTVSVGIITEVCGPVTDSKSQIQQNIDYPYK